MRQVLEEWLDERQRLVAEGERAVFVGRGERRLRAIGSTTSSAGTVRMPA